MDADGRKRWFRERLEEERIIARTDFDGIENQVDRDALRDDFDGWYQRIDAAEDKKLNINNVLDENFPTEALIEALDTEEDFQNFASEILIYQYWAHFSKQLLTTLEFDGKTMADRILKNLKTIFKANKSIFRSFKVHKRVSKLILLATTNLIENQCAIGIW